MGRINQGFNDGGLIAAILIDRQPGVPPLDLIRAVLLSATSSRVNKTIEAALTTIKDRLTEPTWLRLLRWLTFDSDRSVAASAAIFANDIEPQPSALIRKPLLDALHDGAYVWRAEPLLRKAVDQGGTGQVHWLANEIAHADRMMGGHSGWWRIFLANLEKTGTMRPSFWQTHSVAQDRNEQRQDDERIRSIESQSNDPHSLCPRFAVPLINVRFPVECAPPMSW